MALSHAIGDKVEAAYRRGDLLEKRVALMADWAAFLTEASGRARKSVRRLRRPLATAFARERWKLETECDKARAPTGRRRIPSDLAGRSKSLSIRQRGLPRHGSWRHDALMRMRWNRSNPGQLDRVAESNAGSRCAARRPLLIGRAISVRLSNHGSLPSEQRQVAPIDSRDSLKLARPTKRACPFTTSPCQSLRASTSQ